MKNPEMAHEKPQKPRNKPQKPRNISIHAN